MDQKVTIKDVAKSAGVGVGTVSRVINQNKSVKPYIRNQVETAIKMLGYQPDSTARSLRTKQSKTIVFFVNDISNITFSTMAKGFHDVFEEYDYNLILYNFGTSKNKEKLKEKIVFFFTTRKVDGAILVLPEENNASLNKFLGGLKVPLIFLDREMAGIQASFVYTDYYSGIKKAVDYLVKLGHKQIGFTSGSLGIRPARESLNSYLDALKLNDIPINQDLIRTGDFTEEYGRESMDYFADKVKNREVTALICGSYLLLVGFLESIQNHKLRLPEDISLIAFEDSDLARLMNPAISVIRRPLRDMGRKVAYYMIDLLNASKTKKNHETSSIIIPTELVIRSSTATT